MAGRSLPDRSAGRAPNGSIRERPVIWSGRAGFRAGRAWSAPHRRRCHPAGERRGGCRRPASAAPDSGCAVSGPPSSSINCSALPWSAVIRALRQASAQPRSTMRPRHASTTSRPGWRRPDASVADHVGVGVVGDDEVVVARREAPSSSSVIAGGAHLRLEVVGGDLRRGTSVRSSPGTAPPRRR